MLYSAQKMSNLKNGGFKHIKEFKCYTHAPNGIGIDSKVGRDYFENEDYLP